MAESNTSTSQIEAVRCAECGRLIAQDPIALEDERYCCMGCLAGGPCICDEVERRDAHERVRAPVHLEIGPFSGQADLMHLATLLEGRPGILGVALVVADL